MRAKILYWSLWSRKCCPANGELADFGKVKEVDTSSPSHKALGQEDKIMRPSGQVWMAYGGEEGMALNQEEIMPFLA